MTRVHRTDGGQWLSQHQLRAGAKERAWRTSRTGPYFVSRAVPGLGDVFILYRGDCVVYKITSSLADARESLIALSRREIKEVSHAPQR